MSSIEVGSLVVNTTLNVDAFTNNLTSLCAATSKYLSVEIIQQPANTNICWLITVTSIANYVFNASYTYEGIFQLFNGGYERTMHIEDVFSRFNNVALTSWQSEYITTLDPDLVLFYLENGYPLYSYFKSIGGLMQLLRVVSPHIRHGNKNTCNFQLGIDFSLYI